MRQPEPETTRAETVMAALLYLMTHYARTGCPRLAVCVSRHLQCLALHPDAPAVVRDVCASLHGSWGEVAAGPRSDAGPVH
jgi:hypothetical protein